MTRTPGRRQRLHALAGVLWPAVVLGSLALHGSAARGGARPFAQRVDGGEAWVWLTLVVFVGSLTIWLVTGVAERFAAGDDESLRRLRRALVVPVTAFGLAHAWLFWAPVAVWGGDGRALYAELVRTLSHPVPAWLYALGATLTALQLEQSLRVAGEVFGFPRRERSRQWYRASAIVISVLLLLVVYDGLGALIAGRPLFGGAE